MVKIISNHIADIFGILSFVLGLLGASLRNKIIIGTCVATLIVFIVAHVIDDRRLRRKANELETKSETDTQNIRDLREQIKKVQAELTTTQHLLDRSSKILTSNDKTLTNLDNLYQDSKKENERYAVEQRELQALIISKNQTFGSFIFRQLKDLENQSELIALLHEFKLDPGRETELIQSGLDAVNEVVTLRKEIDALETKGEVINESK